jgi:hypothetical protein
VAALQWERRTCRDVAREDQLLAGHGPHSSDIHHRAAFLHIAARVRYDHLRQGRHKVNVWPAPLVRVGIAPDLLMASWLHTCASSSRCTGSSVTSDMTSDDAVAPRLTTTCTHAQAVHESLQSYSGTRTRIGKSKKKKPPRKPTKSQLTAASGTCAERRALSPYWMSGVILCSAGSVMPVPQHLQQ